MRVLRDSRSASYRFQAFSLVDFWFTIFPSYCSTPTSYINKHHINDTAHHENQIQEKFPKYWQTLQTNKRRRIEDGTYEVELTRCTTLCLYVRHCSTRSTITSCLSPCNLRRELTNLRIEYELKNIDSHYTNLHVSARFKHLITSNF